MAHPPLHHFLRSMIQKQTTDRHESHQQKRPKEAIEEPADIHTSSCWTVTPDNAASHSTKKRVHWKEDDNGSLGDCRWGNSSWSSSQDCSRRWAIESSPTNKPQQGRVVSRSTFSSNDCFLKCPKRRVSMDADQLVALLTMASVVRD